MEKEIVFVESEPGEFIHDAVNRAYKMWYGSSKKVVILKHNDRFVVFNCPKELFTIENLMGGCEK